MSNIDGPYNFKCWECDTIRTIHIRREEERGDFGTLLSAWLEYDVSPPCLGFTDDSDEIYSYQKVTPQLIKEADLDAERCAERCPFHKYYENDHLDPVSFILGMRSERKKHNEVS